MKTKRFLSLAVIFAVALAFFACSSDSPSGGGQQGGEPSSDSSGGNQMVFCKLNAGTCSQMSLSTCMELVNAGAAQIVSNCNAEPPPPTPSSSSIAPPPPSPSSSSSRPSSSSRVVSGYCDYGPITTYGGGCFPMATAEDEANCKLPANNGKVVSSCPSSSSVVVKTQYYDIIVGNWNASCPDLNNYPTLKNAVMPLDDSVITLIDNCLINSDVYERYTSTQVANYLATNNLSKYASDFDSKIAASPYDAAFLIYVNTSNYYRILVIGYSD